MRDVENVRYCHTPIDGQQINRCEYALRNMEIRLLTIHNCIQRGGSTLKRSMRWFRPNIPGPA